DPDKWTQSHLEAVKYPTPDTPRIVPPSESVAVQRPTGVLHARNLGMCSAEVAADVAEQNNISVAARRSDLIQHTVACARVGDRHSIELTVGCLYQAGERCQPIPVIREIMT